MQGQQSALLDSQPCSSHAPQPAVDQLEISRRSQSHLAQALRPARGAPPQPSYAHSDNPSIVMQSPSVSGEDAAQSVAGEDPAQSIAGETQAQHSLQEPARFACAPARKRLSYARLGPAGFDGALETAGPECRAAQDSAGLRRFKIRNRFRAGAFRRCHSNSSCSLHEPKNPVWPPHAHFPLQLPHEGIMRLSPACDVQRLSYTRVLT